MNKKNIKLIVLLGVSVAGGLYLNKDKSEATVGRNLNKLLSGNTASLVTRFNSYIGSGKMATPANSMRGNGNHINNSNLVRPSVKATTSGNAAGVTANVTKASNKGLGVVNVSGSNKVEMAVGGASVSGITKGNNKTDIKAVGGRGNKITTNAIGVSGNKDIRVTKGKDKSGVSGAKLNDKNITSVNGVSGEGNVVIKGNEKNKDRKVHRRNDLKESTVIKGNSSGNGGRRGFLEYLGIKSSNRNKQNTVDISNDSNGNKNIDIDPKLRVSLYISERGSGKKRGKEQLSFNKMQFRVNKDDLDGFSNDIEHSKRMKKQSNGVSGELKLRNETGNTKGMLEGLLGSLNISVEDEKTGKVDKVLLGKKDIVVIKHKQGNLKGELKIRTDKNQQDDIKLNVYWQE